MQASRWNRKVADTCGRVKRRANHSKDDETGEDAEQLANIDHPTASYYNRDRTPS